MPIDSIIRGSFESNVLANQAINSALVGHPQNKKGTGPFEKVGTAVYTCHGANEIAVGKAIADLGTALATHASTLDSIFISIVRT